MSQKQQLSFYFFSNILVVNRVSINLSKWCVEKAVVYILRLLAGKFGAICTEFPLATFSAKKLKRIRLQISRQKINKCYLVQKIQSRNFDFFPHNFKVQLAIFLSTKL